MASPSDRAGSGVDWDAMYRAEDTPWDRGEAHPALLWWLEGNPLTGRVLVPGCGRGHDVRAIAAYHAKVTGLDLSTTALEDARKAPPVGNEEYVIGDFFHPPNEWLGTFDAIVEHTCFCAIDPQMRTQYSRAAGSLLKPGGSLLAIFFLDPGKDDGPPFGCTPGELDGLFASDFTLEREERTLPTYPGRENREMLRLYRRH